MNSLTSFWNGNTYAVVGVSRSGKGFGCVVYRALKGTGRTVVPINRNGGQLDGETLLADLTELKQEMDGVVVVVPPAEAARAVERAAEAGISRVWLQPGSESPEVIAAARRHGIESISGACALMFLPGTSLPHACHRWVLQAVGKLPQG